MNKVLYYGFMMKKIIIYILIIFQIGELFAQVNNDSILFNERMNTITKSKGIVRLKEDVIDNIEEVVIYDQEGNINIRFSYKDNYLMLLDTLYDLYITPNSEKVYDFEQSYYFNPMLFSFEPTIVLFECKEEIDGYWKVFLNKEHSILGLIKQSTGLFYFESWYEHFIGAMINIKRDNIIKKEPFYSSDTINLGKDESIYTITEIRGDWVKIECLSELVSCPNNEESGWTKWIEGDKIIVELSFFP